MKVIYIAAPYSIGDPVKNVRNAIYAAEFVIENGGAPINPILSHYHKQLFPHKYDDWMRVDFEIMVRCDAVYRVAGKSDGADSEVTLALISNIPVFGEHDRDKLIEFLQS